MNPLSKSGVAALVAAGALAAPGGAAADATISFNFPAYNPANVTIPQGDKVTWIAEPGHDFGPQPGPTHHPLRFVGGSEPEQLSGTVTSRQFDEQGTFAFYCVYHWSIGMYGSVSVTAPAAPGSPPPPAPAPAPSPTSAPLIAAPNAEIVIGNRRSLKGIRRYGMVVRARTNQPVRAHVALRLGEITVGNGAKSLPGGGEHGVAISMTKNGRRTLRKLRRARLQVVLTVTDALGNARTVVRSFRTTK
jgi:plastocyanin